MVNLGCCKLQIYRELSEEDSVNKEFHKMKLLKNNNGCKAALLRVYMAYTMTFYIMSNFNFALMLGKL